MAATLFSDKQLLGIGAVVLVGGYLLWTKALPKVGEAVSPTNPDNVFNSGFDALYQSITGPNRTLGGDIADWLHGDNSDTITGG